MGEGSVFNEFNLNNPTFKVCCVLHHFQAHQVLRTS